MITKHTTSRSLLVQTQAGMDALRVEHFRQKVQLLLDEGYINIIFDMAATEYINSSGLGWMVEVYKKTQERQGTFKILNASEQVRWLFHQSHLEELLSEAIAPGGSREGAGGETHETRFDRLHELMSAEILLLTQINHVTQKILALDELDEIGEEVLRGAKEMSRADFGCLLLVDEDGDHLRLIKTENGGSGREVRRRPYDDQTPIKLGRLEHRILESGEVLWQNLEELDPTERRLFYDFGFRNLLAASISSHHRCFGLLALEGTEETRRLLHAAKPILATFTQICGQAFENTMLTRQLVERNKELNSALARLRASHQSLMNAGRLAAMGTVVSGLGHQLNNKLVPVIGYCQLLAQQKTLPRDVAGRIDMIQTASCEMQMIIEKLLRLSRVRERLETVVDPHECLRVALDLLSGQIEINQIRLELIWADSAPKIKGDTDLLLQALLAIMHRSCTSYTPEQPNRWLRVLTQYHEEMFQIVIEDNGAGLNAYDNEDWLDPLVPLQEINQGQIFNYNIPRNVVKRHGGRLTVTNRAAGGKRALIELKV